MCPDSHPLNTRRTNGEGTAGFGPVEVDSACSEEQRLLLASLLLGSLLTSDLHA